MRHRQHRQHTREGLVLGLLAGGAHAECVADGTDVRPKRAFLYGVPMSVAEQNPASRTPLDAILLKVLEAVPFQLTTDGGVEASRQRFRDLPRRQVHPEVRTENRTVDGPAGP